MVKYVNLFIELVSNPRQFIEQNRQNNFIFGSLAVFGLSIFCRCLAEQVILVNAGKHSLVIFSLNFLLKIICYGISILLYLSWINFLANLYNKSGDLKFVITNLAIGYGMFVFILPVDLILTSMITNPGILHILAVFVLNIVYMVFSAFIIKIAYSLTTVETILILFSPLIFLPVFLVFLLILSAVFIYAIFI